MSAFILSDRHFSTIAIYLYNINGNIDVQTLANRLKSINIDSVNYRYNESTRKSKVKIENVFNDNRYNKLDIIRLIQCWSYQSCENASNLDYLIMDAFLFSFFDNDEIQRASLESNIWNI